MQFSYLSFTSRARTMRHTDLMKIPTIVSGMALSFLLFSASIQAAPVVYTTNLSASAEADSENTSTGTGSAWFTHDWDTHVLTISVMFSGLTGVTTVSHIHAATDLAFSGNAGVATQVPTFTGFPGIGAPPGVTTGSYENSFDLSLAGSFNPAFVTSNGGSVAMAEASLIAAMEGGNAYLNIHTVYKPAGEIRGYIARRVPDTASTLALLIPGFLMAIGLTYRNRRTA